MPKITLTRQVTGSDQVTLAPGEHEVSEFEANMYRAAGWTDEPPETGAIAPVAEPAPVLVEIPADWESWHHLQQIKLASEISGSKSTRITPKRALEVIRAELEKRNG